MSSHRLALVAEDHRVAASVQGHLHRALGHSPFLCTFDSVRRHLGRDTDGLLLLAAVTPGNAEPIVRLVQEIYLLKLPPIILLVEAGSFPDAQALAGLDPYVAHRLRWPDDAERLTTLVRDRLGRVRSFLATQKESVHDVIRRRLLSMTPSLVPLVERIALASAHDVTVLLTGETGTGKTFLARLMHDCSPRQQHPFLTVPCGAIPANLVESAFFGHVKGAFTGADRAKAGKFAAAGHGTILLDEIDTLGLEHQASLLRVIETGEYEAVGGNETQTCTARIIVASNWDLEEAVERGLFRQDLYYRLNVISFHLPPLRERVQDIAPLVRGMAARFNTKFRKDLFDISPEALAALESFPWPGNIRQLENVVQQGVLLSSGPELLPEHLPPAVQAYVPAANGRCPSGNGNSNGAVNGNGAAHAPGKGHANGQGGPDSLQHNWELLERNVIQRALANNGYSRTRTAQALGISRVTLYKKMQKYGMMSKPSRSRREE
jgi:two-component system, NtrC family, response regulator HydG